jgi:threonine dehydrogenase-like Zn-dependent dehydrogenase
LTDGTDLRFYDGGGVASEGMGIGCDLGVIAEIGSAVKNVEPGNRVALGKG